MAFKLTEITREHVLKGIEEIKKSKKPLTDGTRWEVIIDGKSYPPKEVICCTHFSDRNLKDLR